VVESDVEGRSNAASRTTATMGMTAIRQPATQSPSHGSGTPWIARSTSAGRTTPSVITVRPRVISARSIHCEVAASGRGGAQGNEPGGSTRVPGPV
jgi:hypothetical protein